MQENLNMKLKVHRKLSKLKFANTMSKVYKLVHYGVHYGCCRCRGKLPAL